MLLQLCDSIVGGSARCEHRVDHEYISVLDIGRELAEIFYRLQGLMITIETDVTDFCRRKKCFHT